MAGNKSIQELFMAENVKLFEAIPSIGNLVGNFYNLRTNHMLSGIICQKRMLSLA